MTRHHLGIILCHPCGTGKKHDKPILTKASWGCCFLPLPHYTSLHLITPHRISHTSIIITSIPRISKPTTPQKKTYKKTMWKKPAIVDCLQWLWLGWRPNSRATLRFEGIRHGCLEVSGSGSKVKSPLCETCQNRIQFRRSFTNPPFKL